MYTPPPCEREPERCRSRLSKVLEGRVVRAPAKHQPRTWVLRQSRPEVAPSMEFRKTFEGTNAGWVTPFSA